MDIKVVRRGPILLVGMGFFGDPFSGSSAWDVENEIGALWKRFMAFLSAAPDAVADRADRGKHWYELHIPAAETPRTGRYEVFVGVEVRGLSAVPVACSAKVLPAAEYAMLTVRGPEITGDWEGRLRAGIASSLGRRADAAFSFELYDERFRGLDRLEESELDGHIPLLPATEG